MEKFFPSWTHLWNRNAVLHIFMGFVTLNDQDNIRIHIYYVYKNISFIQEVHMNGHLVQILLKNKLIVEKMFTVL